jgi:hypothetical protein
MLVLEVLLSSFFNVRVNVPSKLVKELDKINDHKKLVNNVVDIIVDLWKKMDAMNFKVLQMLSEYSKAKNYGGTTLVEQEALQCKLNLNNFMVNKFKVLHWSPRKQIFLGFQKPMQKIEVEWKGVFGKVEVCKQQVVALCTY